jgi:soluble P-type ATPase
MIRIDIPDFGVLRLEHIVLDYNGTLAVDGNPVDGVKEKLGQLSSTLTVHVLTADTFGKVQAEMADVPCTITVLGLDAQDRTKEAYVRRLGTDVVVAVGNGRNDRRMLQTSALGIAVLLEEGASVLTLQAADVVCKDILSALDLLSNPKRLIATLRS